MPKDVVIASLDLIETSITKRAPQLAAVHSATVRLKVVPKLYYGLVSTVSITVKDISPRE